MLTERIIGAFTFRKGVYAEVEKDTNFTTTAWILVVVVALLTKYGANESVKLLKILLGAVVGNTLKCNGSGMAHYDESLDLDYLEVPPRTMLVD